MQQQGSLVVVGTGINTLAHCSIEAKAHIEQAERLIVHVPDTLGMLWLREIKPDLIDLQDCYGRTENRADAYELMIRTVSETVIAGYRTVAVFYGHPGVFVYPSHEVIRRLRATGYRAEMLPGISAEDCLIADIGADPARSGCTQHEATAFLFYQHSFDTHVSLILWQIGVVGDHSLSRTVPAGNGLRALRDKLLRYYPAEHRVAIYEAPTLAVAKARVDWLPLAQLDAATVSLASTLYVPSFGRPVVDIESIQQLGITTEQALQPVQTLQ